MTSGMPELGSKISLISKADIRYEGRLFTVDPTECTIALASVRSFGTEERETAHPVLAQNQVYDYILFRGSDIKDIRVINNLPSLPNDPAIMQLSVPPSLGQHQFHNQGYNHPVVGSAMASSVGQFNTGYGNLAGIGGFAPGIGVGQSNRSGPSNQSELIIPGPVPLTDLPSAVEPPRPSEHDFIGGGSRSTTPLSLGSRKSSTADQGIQVAGGKKDDKRMTRPIQPPGQNRNQQRDRRDSKGENQQHYISEPYRNQNRPMQNRVNQQYHGNQQNNRQTGWGGAPNRGQPRSSRGFRPRGPPNGGPNPGTNSNYRQNQQSSQSAGGKPKSTLKFENDYDFEQANNQFSELQKQFEKIKIKDGKTEVVNGDNEKKDDSGNETGAGEGEQEDEEQIFYDKAKSFFDNISCEAVERSKGRSQRTDWRAERKLNSETFGVSSARRTNFRGRGGYYNRGGGYRPGFRGGYRPQGGNRRPHPQENKAPISNQQTIPQSSDSNNSNQRQTTTTVATVSAVAAK